MNINPDAVPGEGWQKWRQFLVLLVAFLFIVVVASMLPTPGSWSDMRSDWLPPAIIAPTALCLMMANFRIYRRPGFLFKIQAVILWFLFGGIFAAAVCDLYESYQFFHAAKDG
jgi:hypothetical protein